jgi:hypothetical protein
MQRLYQGGVCWLQARGVDLGIQIVDFARTYLPLSIPEGLELPLQLGVRDAFELSWQELDESAKQLGLCLSLFALAPIPWQLVERCLPEIDAEELEETRDYSLVNSHLVQRKGTGSYQLHPLIREFLISNPAEQSHFLKPIILTVCYAIALFLLKCAH